MRSGDPAADFRFGELLRLNVSAFLDLHELAKRATWTEKLQLRLDVSNLGDTRQRVRDGNGETPNRFQADYLDPVGRTVTVSLRKLF